LGYDAAFPNPGDRLPAFPTPARSGILEIHDRLYRGEPVRQAEEPGVETVSREIADVATCCGALFNGVDRRPVRPDSRPGGTD